MNILHIVLSLLTITVSISTPTWASKEPGNFNLDSSAGEHKGTEHRNSNPSRGGPAVGILTPHQRDALSRAARMRARIESSTSSSGVTSSSAAAVAEAGPSTSNANRIDKPFSPDFFDEAYQEALLYRDNKVPGVTSEQSQLCAEQIFQAIAVFGHARAMHNLASIAYKQKEYERAYGWWKRAANEGLDASKRNLDRLKKELIISEQDQEKLDATLANMLTAEFKSDEVLYQFSQNIRAGKLNLSALWFYTYYTLNDHLIKEEIGKIYPEFSESYHSFKSSFIKSHEDFLLRLNNLEEKRTRYWQNGSYQDLEHVTREISTLIRSYTLNQRLALHGDMLDSVIKTRRLFPGSIDLFDLYDTPSQPATSFIEIFFVDTLQDLINVNSDVYDLLCSVKNQDDPSLLKVKQLTEDWLKKGLYPMRWESLDVDLMLETFIRMKKYAPVIYLDQVFNDLMVSGDKGYMGWQIIGLDSLASWPNGLPGEIRQMMLATLEFEGNPPLEALSLRANKVDDKAIAQYPQLKSYRGQSYLNYFYSIWLDQLHAPIEFLLVRSDLNLSENAPDYIDRMNELKKRHALSGETAYKLEEQIKQVRTISLQALADRSNMPSVHSESDKAHLLAKQGAEMGNVTCLYAYGIHQIFKGFVKNDTSHLRAAYETLRRSADQGFPISHVALSILWKGDFYWKSNLSIAEAYKARAEIIGCSPSKVKVTVEMMNAVKAKILSRRASNSSTNGEPQPGLPA